MREYLLGNVAMAQGLLEAGTGLVAGYPGTPTSEIIESLVELKGDNPIHIEWSVNEKVALEVAIGASWTGTRSTATMKHVGLNVAADPFMTLTYLGVGAGLVIIVADDPNCHSSQNEQDSRRYAQFASAPCLDPADPQEAKEMTIFGFELSERLDLPVLIRPTTRVSHARADVEVSQAFFSRDKRGFAKNVPRRVALPAHVRPLHAELVRKQKRVLEALEDTPWNKLELNGNHGVVASGISSLYADEVLHEMDLNLSFLKIGTVPAPSNLLHKLLDHVEKVLIIEELEPVLEEQVERIARKVNPEVEILGKGDYIQREGELDLLKVRNAISLMEGLPLRLIEPIPETNVILPPRPPALCPGCSHRATYFAMRKAFGKGAIYPSDIGCYTMAVNMGTVDTCLCMGASITLATGIRFGGESEDICCSLGDSTFLHGGLTGLLNAAYNKAHITVTILDNGTTAMTGHQPHAGTGVMATGETTTQISLEDLAKALGAGLVQTVDPYDFPETVEAFKDAKEFPGLSVVIAKQSCVIVARRSGVKRRLFAVEDDCSGCKLCLQFGCPAFEFDGETAMINSLCTGCGVCAQICPSLAIKEVAQ